MKAKTAVIHLRVTREERQAICKAAGDLSVSAWLRALALKAARAEK